MSNSSRTYDIFEFRADERRESEPTQVPPYRLLADVCQLGYKSEVQKWLEAIEDVSDREVDSIFDRFPEGWMSAPSIKFANQILATTRNLMRQPLEES